MIDLKNLSYEEKEAIDEFRMRVEKDLDSIMLEDETVYYRFLKARDFNIDKAEKMLRKHIIWRKAKQANTIREDFVPKEVFLKYLEPSDIGMDKKGNFVGYCPLGKLDSRDIVQCFQINNYFDHWIWYGERTLFKFLNVTKKSEKVEKTYPQMVFILDLDQLTFSNATSKITAELLLGILSILSDNYPESLSSVYIINAPRYYLIPFTILKNMMSNAMFEKFLCFGKDGWKEALLKCIDADVLPAFLGGNRTDPDGDPLCKTFVTHGNIPVTCYSLSDEERYFTDKTQIQTVSIPKNSRKEVDVDVTEEGSVIQWEFLVKNKDIGIGLFRKDLELIEILPVLRYYTVDGATKMSYKARRAGKYVLVFENSYSWMKSKEVQYTVKVVKPGN